MNIFLLHTFLAFSWAALTESFTLGNLSIGYVLAYAALWVAKPLFGDDPYFDRLPRVGKLILLFFYELIVSSLRVVWDVITPKDRSRPGIIAVPLDAREEGTILLIANLISLTPGTLSLDLSQDRKTLYVHSMFIDDPDELRKELKKGMERAVIEAVE